MSQDASVALLLIGDGLGDRPNPSFNGLTPTEVAYTPNMDKLAHRGISGRFYPIKPGVRAGSDTAHLAILGFDPYSTYTGRGPFEAMGIGLDVRQGDVAFRCNFSTVDSQMVVTDRRAGRIEKGTAQLAKALDGLEIDGVRCLFKESVAHRAALVLRGEGLGAYVSDADPHAEGQPIHPCHPLEKSDGASAKTCAIVNQFVRLSYEILKEHPVNKERISQGLPPANVALPRGAGLAPVVGSFEERWGLSGAVVVEVGLVKGIGRYVGMEVVDVPEATGGLDTDTDAITQATLKALQRHRFVLCNVKGPDVAGHDGDFLGKESIIEKIDQMLGVFMDELGPDALIMVTGDHCTPVTVGDHTGEYVPFAMCGSVVRPDNVDAFGETACQRGGLGTITGNDIMPFVTNFLGVQEKFGA